MLPYKIAVITDTHATLPALEAALQAIAAEGCDAIYHTGDAISVCPYPAEVMDRLLTTPNLHLIMGNHDEWFAFGLPEPQPAWMSDGAVHHLRWVHAQLDPALRPIVAEWPYAITERIHGLKLLFTHYGLNDAGTEFQPIVSDPAPADLDRLFARERTDLVFYGHYHPPSDLQGTARYVNIGSLGCNDHPTARFALLSVHSDGTYHLEQRVLPYDQSDLFRQFVERDVAEREFICRAFFGQSGG